jgi:tetrahydromethanopterin S-methyltransferase subunit A
MSIETERQTRAVEGATEQLRKAVTARKCHPCGCLHQTVSTLAETEVGRQELASVLDQVRRVLTAKEYDCLGCSVCYPALASNALGDAYPEAAERLAACPTNSPTERAGWPPLPGDYHVIRYGAPVAVCTLNSADLAERLAEHPTQGLAIVGTLHTENLGIERIIRNVLANPSVRFLVLCGEDTRQAIGHLPGQSLMSLFTKGVDDRGHIREAQGKRPVLKNVTADEVTAFLRQVELVSLIGEEHEEVIQGQIAAAQARDPGPLAGAVLTSRVEMISATEPRRLVADPAGFFVVYPDASRQRLVVEHYTVAGVLDSIIVGSTPAAVWTEVIERHLLTRLDHAAYLGRELASAERSLRTGERYVQDRAPGEPGASWTQACGCDSHAGHASGSCESMPAHG